MSEINKIEIGGKSYDISDAQLKSELDVIDNKIDDHINDNSEHLKSFKVNGVEYKTGDKVELDVFPSDSKIDNIKLNNEIQPIVNKVAIMYAATPVQGSLAESAIQEDNEFSIAEINNYLDMVFGA